MSQLLRNTQHPLGHAKTWTLQFNFQGKNLTRDYKTVRDCADELKQLLGNPPMLFININGAFTYLTSTADWMKAILEHD